MVLVAEIDERKQLTVGVGQDSTTKDKSIFALDVKLALGIGLHHSVVEDIRGAGCVAADKKNFESSKTSKNVFESQKR